MRKPRRIVDYGPAALLLEWEQKMDPAISAGVHAYQKKLATWPEVVESVPAYASLLIVIELKLCRQGELRERLYELSLLSDEVSPHKKIHRLPVCYDGEDLPAVSAATGLPVEDVIALHSFKQYTVYQLGFRLGFGFLGDLDMRLRMPRRPSPRTEVAAGSVAIAGLQTAIYPSPSPGGWRLIGRCPIPMLDVSKPIIEASLLNAGDLVSFRPISRIQYNVLSTNPTLWKP